MPPSGGSFVSSLRGRTAEPFGQQPILKRLHGRIDAARRQACQPVTPAVDGQLKRLHQPPAGQVTLEPRRRQQCHAGALISGGADTADAKLAVMEECGFTITRNPSEMARLLKALL